MDIKIDETYTLRSKRDLKFSIYKKKVTRERVVVKEGIKKKIPLEKEEQVAFDGLVASGLTIEECIRKLISFKIEDIKTEVSLEEFLKTYIEEKKKFEETINKVLNIK